MSAEKSTKEFGINALGVAPLRKGATDVVQVHFVEDGITAFGQIWYRGQEVAVERGSEDWKRTVDPGTGESWLDLDEDGQVAKWDRRMFRTGKWAGKGYDTEGMSDEQKAELLRATGMSPIAATKARAGAGSSAPKIR